MFSRTQPGSTHALFPFYDKDRWKAVLGVVQGVETWSPLVLAQTLHKIREIDRDQPFKVTPHKKYGTLLKLLGDVEEFVGDESLLWGGAGFTGQVEELPRISWWFCNHTLPHVTALLLQLPQLFPSKVALCNGSKSTKLSLTKKQCAAILAMAFFGANDSNSCQLFPTDDYQTLLTFQCWLETPSYCNKAKLFMLMNYFERTRLQIKEETFEVHRLRLSAPHSLSSWLECSAPLSQFQVHDTGGITETCAGDVLHVDFANRYIGGGVLSMGAVQEEIMFSVCPELLVSLHFCSVMRDDEALLLNNAEKIAAHRGYNTGLTFAGDFVDDTRTCRVAIDATCYGWGQGSEEQWSQPMILRELNKAFVGFDNEFPHKGAGIATGNWGCGAFGGNIQLKSLLQWCAGSACGRPLQYYTFKDRNCAGLHETVAVIQQRGCTVGQLLEAILSYCRNRTGTLFQFIDETFS